LIDNHEPDVVTGGCVFGPRISEAGNQTNLWMIFHTRSTRNPRSAINATSFAPFLLELFPLQPEQARHLRPLPFSR
jgi:hypothetical protein